MGIFNFNFNSKKTKNEDVKTNNESLSSPFYTIGKGDLTKPYINDLNGVNEHSYIRFGTTANDNIYPDIINQMYYTSPLNSAIINFKINTIIGGGYNIENKEDSINNNILIKTFIKQNKFNKLLKNLTLNYIMHERVGILIDIKNKKIKLIKSEKIRTNKNINLAFVCDDWLRSGKIDKYPIYDGTVLDKPFIYLYNNETPGQDIYPIPSYSSAFNWCYLDGESSVLHKGNIQESIFPSLVIRRPKRFATLDDQQEFINGIIAKKGSNNAGTVIVLTGDGKDMLPEIETIQPSGNDKLMMQTDERMDARICQAHQIDPMIMGIRVSGKLGSGQEVFHSYLTFEKNYVMPTRNIIEEIINDIFDKLNIKGEFTLNNFQIVAEQIIDKTKIDNNKNNIEG